MKDPRVLMMGGQTMGKQAGQIVAVMAKVQAEAAEAERARLRDKLLAALRDKDTAPWLSRADVIAICGAGEAKE